jgi:hypothetical protein
MTMTRYRITIEEQTFGERRVLGLRFADLHRRVIVDVECDERPTLRALAAVLEPEPTP